MQTGGGYSDNAVIPMEIDANGEFVGPKANRMGSFMSPLAHQSKYIPLEYSDWKKFTNDKLKVA